MISLYPEVQSLILTTPPASLTSAFPTRLINSLEKEKIQFPVVLKFTSNTILHKTEMGAVELNINNHEDLVNKYIKMKKIAIIGAGISGLFIANLFKDNLDYHITIYEKNTSINLDEGYGIQLSTNSIRLLNRIGFNTCLLYTSPSPRD